MTLTSGVTVSALLQVMVENPALAPPSSDGSGVAQPVPPHPAEISINGEQHSMEKYSYGR